MMRSLPLLLALTTTLAASPAAAHSDSHGKKSAAPSAASAEEKSFGKPADAKKVTRTVTVDMSYSMRFTPATLTVKQGDTVKFLVKNSGKVMHEFVLGTMKELKEHAELMKKHPGMEHDEPYMAHVAPGKTATVIWQFTRSGEFHFGCLLPGHFEAGMVGNIKVTTR
jgi:uncharacterized cupredoxin-like copper-binding protein